MNTALWVLQIVVALAFLGSGAAKLFMPIDGMAKQMGWVTAMPPQAVRTIGLLEVLGAIGLIVPWLTNILPWLTPLAAVGLVLTMIGAVALHVSRKEMGKMVPPVVLLVLAAIIAVGRFSGAV